eukprot:SAG31_NODE_11_length_38734_cov_21.263854_16_plen_294_part_00
MLDELPESPEKEGDVVWVGGQAFVATVLADQLGWLTTDCRPVWAPALPSVELQQAALETLLQCEMAEGVEVEQLFDDVSNFRVSMSVSRSQTAALVHRQLSDDELHQPSCSVTARLEPLLTRRIEDFESQDAMAEWFDRQVAVVLAGLCYILERGGKMAPVEKGTLNELHSTALTAFDQLKDGLMGADEEAITASIELLMQVRAGYPSYLESMRYMLSLCKLCSSTGPKYHSFTVLMRIPDFSLLCAVLLDCDECTRSLTIMSLVSQPIWHSLMPMDSRQNLCSRTRSHCHIH